MAHPGTLAADGAASRGVLLHFEFPNTARGQLRPKVGMPQTIESISTCTRKCFSMIFSAWRVI
jgi:hypothetical protein